MRIQRIGVSMLFAAAVAALPLSAAKAQYYYPCHPFPLFWPFCAATAVVGAAATIATAPFRAFAPYRYPYYYRPNPAYSYAPYYYPPQPAYYAPGYYYGRPY